jgi:poly(3-hydroxybutyrate) depolymerase
MKSTLLPPLLFATLFACTPEPEPLPEGEAPVAEYDEPVALEVDEWLVGFLDDPSNDVVQAAIEAGDFELPERGYDADGTQWVGVDPGDNGAIGSYTAPYYYVVADLDDPLRDGDRVIARSSGTYGTWVGSVRQPGYFYGDRRHRIPLLPRSDSDVVAVQGMQYRGSELQLWSTADELWMNTNDLTAPEIPVGDLSQTWLGVPVLNLTELALPGVIARVIENEFFEQTEVTIPSMAPASVTQMPVLLRPKTVPDDPEATMTLQLRLIAEGLEYSYEREIEIAVTDPDTGHWATQRSPIDGSVQGYGMRRPLNFDPDRDYAVLLSLHGAGVQGRGQARAYEARDWAYIIAPTNRHPFGFDWEEWGRFNALATLDAVSERFRIDPTQVYLAGHSMGGHGTWHVGVTTPGRFATMGPSAGWESFYSYGGSSRPTGSLARARAHSDTLNYIENLERRGVYIIHGDQDDNVPVSEGRNLYAEVSEVSDDVIYHEQPGVGHWWDLDGEEEGADCVDWDPLFDFMQERRLDPYELDFSFRSPSPSYSPTHSYVTILSAEDAYEDVRISSSATDGAVELTTDNVRALEIDGAALSERGVTSLLVDGEVVELGDGTVHVGAVGGKDKDVYGPFNQVFRRPFCFVYPDSGGLYQEYVSYLTSYWAILGNGHACSLPLSALTDAVRAERNLIWVGLDDNEVGSGMPFQWDEDEVEVGSLSRSEAGLLMVFPSDGRLNAVLTATASDPRLLHRISPFSSRAGMPDYLMWTSGSTAASGFFTGDWEYVPGE